MPSFEVKPFVKWAGGKRQLIGEITFLMPREFNHYYEPFIGGGSVFFNLCTKIEKAFISDINSDLITTYQIIKNSPDELIERLREYKQNHCKEFYYEVRASEPVEPLERSARMLYLNKTCFNGLYRVNSKGKFNVPIGSYKDPNIVQEDNLPFCHKALQKAEIRLCDFEEIEPEAGDFVYCDPPYHPLNEGSFTTYTKNDFSTRDQERLKDFLVRLHHKGVFIMLSNSRVDFIEKLYSEEFFRQHVVKAMRAVNSKASGRGPIDELIVTNYEPKQKTLGKKQLDLWG